MERVKHVITSFAHGAVIAKGGEFMYAADLVTSPVVMHDETTWDPVDHEAEARTQSRH